MIKVLSGFLNKHGAKLCALAVLVTAQSVNVCRGMFYQPEEPKNLRKLLDKAED